MEIFLLLIRRMESILFESLYIQEERYVQSLCRVSYLALIILHFPSGCFDRIGKVMKKTISQSTLELYSLWFTVLALGVRRVLSLLRLDMATICVCNPYEFRERLSVTRIEK